MRVRPLDANGDMMPVYSLDQMLSPPEAVKQVIELRLRFYYGEWWEDPDLGFRIPDFLTDGVRSGNIDILTRYISTYVSSTEGVREVLDVASSYGDHKLTFSCVVLTTTGEEETVEVDIDGIL